MAIPVEVPSSFCDRCAIFDPYLLQVDVTDVGDTVKQVLNKIVCDNADKCPIAQIEALKNTGGCKST